MASSTPLYHGKCILIITGASQGFGRTIAQLITNNENGILNNAEVGSRIILMSRNVCELEKTKSLIENNNGHFDIRVVSADLSDVKTSEQVINKTLNDCGKDFSYAFLFSNAATLGDPGKLLPDYNNMEEIQNVFNLNVISSSFLISRFSKYFEGSNRFVINTSTFAALQPFCSIGLYTASKACMDMFVKNLAADCPQIRCLNYSPGAMDTEMAKEMRDKCGNAETRSYFIKLFSEGTIINPVDSVKKLMLLLRKNEFVNGSHIHFRDI